MEDRSTLCPIEYVVYSVVWLVLSIIWYKNTLFRCLPNMTYATSRIVLWILLFLSMAISAGYVYRRNRTGWSIFVSLVFPYGIYMVISYWKTLRPRILIVLVSAAALSLAAGILIMTRKVKRRRNLKRIIVRRFRSCIAVAENIFTVALIIIMAPLFLQEVFGVTLLTSGVEAKVWNENEIQTISSSMDTVLKLQTEKWSSLSTNDKLDVMQCVANIEAKSLGLSNELNVSAANLQEGTLACYSDAYHMIYIDLDHLENDSVEEVLNSCCHEAYHSYQFRLVDAYHQLPEELQKLCIYRNAAYYAYEIVNYVDGEEDFSSYYSQQCEKDARSYAEYEVQNYYSKIDEYIN